MNSANEAIEKYQELNDDLCVKLEKFEHTKQQSEIKQ